MPATKPAPMSDADRASLEIRKLYTADVLRDLREAREIIDRSRGGQRGEPTPVTVRRVDGKVETWWASLSEANRAYALNVAATTLKRSATPADCFELLGPGSVHQPDPHPGDEQQDGERWDGLA